VAYFSENIFEIMSLVTDDCDVVKSNIGDFSLNYILLNLKLKLKVAKMPEMNTKHNREKNGENHI
jgi:hypothetical protein